MAEDGEQLDNNNMVKQPYVNYTLDEDKEEANSKTLNIRLNEKEQDQLEQLKFIWRYDQDAKIIKLALDVLQNVTHSTLGARTIHKATDERRKRSIPRYRFEGESIVRM